MHDHFKIKYGIYIGVLALIILMSGCALHNKAAGEAGNGAETGKDGSADSTKSTGQNDEAGQDSPLKPIIGTKAALPQGRLAIGIPAVSGVFNPLYVSSLYDQYVVDLVFEGLIAQNYSGGFEPLLAKSWQSDPVNHTLQFELRQDILFSDGIPLTAKDVLYTYKVILDSAYQGKYAHLRDSIIKVETRDDFTVVLTFKDNRRSNLELSCVPILPAHYYGRLPLAGQDLYLALEAGVTLDQAPLGSGPYVLNDYSQGKYVALERNLNYTRPGYLIAQLLIKVVSPEEQNLMLMSGGIDLLPQVEDTSQIEEMRALGFSEVDYQDSDYMALVYNCQSGPTADVKVRQALSMALDEGALIKKTDAGLGGDGGNLIAHANHFSPLSWAIPSQRNNGVPIHLFNVERASVLLENLGWKVGPSGIRQQGGVPLKVVMLGDLTNVQFSSMVAQCKENWTALGVAVEVLNVDTLVEMDKLYYRSDENVALWHVCLQPLTFDHQDPTEIASYIHSSQVKVSGDNWSRYKNPQVDKILEEAVSVMSLEDAKPMYQEISTTLAQETPFNPLYTKTYLDIFNPKLLNYKTHTLYPWPKALKAASVKPK